MKVFRKRVATVLISLAAGATMTLFAQQTATEPVETSAFVPIQTELSAPQETPSTSPMRRDTWISTNVFEWFWGPNVGIERALSERWSLMGEGIVHLWFIDTPNVALKSNLKYYFSGSVAQGWYLRANATAGYFWKKGAIENRPFYAGGGVGGGGIVPLTKKKKWYLSLDAGIKFVAPFGQSRDPLEKSLDSFGMAYYSVFSPASLFDLSIGIVYRF